MSTENNAVNPSNPNPDAAAPPFADVGRASDPLLEPVPIWRLGAIALPDGTTLYAPPMALKEHGGCAGSVVYLYGGGSLQVACSVGEIVAACDAAEAALKADAQRRAAQRRAASTPLEQPR